MCPPLLKPLFWKSCQKQTLSVYVLLLDVSLRMTLYELVQALELICAKSFKAKTAQSFVGGRLNAKSLHRTTSPSEE